MSKIVRKHKLRLLAFEATMLSAGFIVAWGFTIPLLRSMALVRSIEDWGICEKSGLRKGEEKTEENILRNLFLKRGAFCVFILILIEHALKMATKILIFLNLRE